MCTRRLEGLIIQDLRAERIRQKAVQLAMFHLEKHSGWTEFT